MRIFGTEIWELREPAEETERERRLAELEEELPATRRRLLRALRDERRVADLFGAEAAFELEQIRAERERLEVALGNLSAERSALLAAV